MTTQDKTYQFLDEDAYDVIAALTKAKSLVSIKENVIKEGKADMCKAINDLIKEGREEGIIEGMTKGRAEGREEGREEKARQMLQNLMNRMECPLDEAMELLGVDENEKERYRERIQQIVL